MATPSEANVVMPDAAVYTLSAWSHVGSSFFEAQSTPANQLMVMKLVLPDKKPPPRESKNAAAYTVV